MNQNRIIHLDWIVGTRTFFYPINKFSWWGGCRTRCNSFRRRGNLFRRKETDRKQPNRAERRAAPEREGDKERARRIPEQREEGDTDRQTKKQRRDKTPRSEATMARWNPLGERSPGSTAPAACRRTMEVETLRKCWAREAGAGLT